jgi:hypothetical protein
VVPWICETVGLRVPVLGRTFLLEILELNRTHVRGLCAVCIYLYRRSLPHGSRQLVHPPACMQWIDGEVPAYLRYLRYLRRCWGVRLGCSFQARLFRPAELLVVAASSLNSPVARSTSLSVAHLDLPASLILRLSARRFPPKPHRGCHVVSVRFPPLRSNIHRSFWLYRSPRGPSEVRVRFF